MIPNADYDDHPAFSPFCKRTLASDGFVGMNSVSDDIVDEFVLTGGRHLDLIENNIRRYEEIAIHDTQIDPRLHNLLRGAFREAHKILVDDKSARATLVDLKGKDASICANVEALYHRGFYLSQLPVHMVARLSELFEADINGLREKAAAGIDVVNYAYPSIPEAHEILNEFFRTSGLYESISAFYGRAYDHFGFALHRSAPHEGWLRVFDDVGLPPAKTLSMHFDAAFDVPKAMLYLNDVSGENGAFSLVPRERPFENIEFDLAFGKILVRELPEVAKNEFGWILRGNESVFRCAPVRELFATLPHSLRRTCDPGDHLLDGSSLSQSLINNEVVLGGPAGFMPVFVGSHTLHRGGLVKSGERIALQLNFYQKQSEPESTTPPVSPSVWQRFRERAKAWPKTSGDANGHNSVTTSAR